MVRQNFCIRGVRIVMSDIKLDRCPFCGSEDTDAQLANPFWMLKRYRGRFVFAGCKSCGASTMLIYADNHTGSPLFNEANLKRALSEVAERWNARAK